MLKKLIRLFLKNRHPEEDVNSYENIDRFQVRQEESDNRASEHKLTGDQYFKDRNYPQAVIYYKHSLELDPTQYEVYKNLGVVNYYQGKFENALNCYDQALVIKSDYPEALNNKGLVLKDMGRHQEALVNLDRAIALKPDLAFAYNNRGIALKSLNRFEEALGSYGRAIELKPDYAEAYNNQGFALKSLNRLENALKSYDCAIELKPDQKFLYGNWFEIKNVFCDWADHESRVKTLEEKINDGKNASAPFIVLSHTHSPDLQRKAAEIFGQAFAPASDLLPPIAQHLRHNKIRVGYFSADFCNHAISFLTAELYETHDRSRFEIVAFSFSSVQDEMTQRLMCAFDQFIDVSKLPDQEVVLMARSMEIDIAIDLGGFTGGCRSKIFAMRAASIQVNYLGYPGTMGVDYMDYIIADATLIPKTHQQYYSEKIAYLPSFQVNDTKRIISNRKFIREELALPSTDIVFCCFNNIPKINPAMFDVWMRILKQVEGSVLWLLDEHPTAVNNLRREAAARGVEGSRIVFAKRELLPDYLARYRMADLFLDTLPFNAGTTASDALWAGLPVLTQIGESFSGRMAASLLKAIDLPELITTTQEDYEALAVELATNPDKLAKIKQKLANNRLTTPLFDIQHFTKHIESAYTQMYERYQAGLGPDHIDTLHKTS